MARNTAANEYDRGRRTDDRSDEDRQTASLAGLAVSLALLVASLFLVYHLREKSRLEDCLLAGRQNCMVLPGLR